MPTLRMAAAYRTSEGQAEEAIMIFMPLAKRLPRAFGAKLRAVQEVAGRLRSAPAAAE